MGQSSSPAARLLSTLGWGLFCASSWTWCVGMFLPAILLHRGGWPAFLAFALPNVLGCAAFGYVLKTAQRSRVLVERHEGAMGAFSLVTIAFHVFFIAFIALACLPTLLERPWLAVVLAAAVFAIGLVASDLPEQAWTPFAAVVYLVSLGAFVSVGVEPLGLIEWTGNRPPSDVAWLAPTMAFGFLLCPFLDRTFHTALQSSPSRHAFGAFAATFALMILLTCAYAGQIGTGLGALVVAHLFAQSIFTVGAHAREARRWLARRARPRGAGFLVLPLLAAPLALVSISGAAEAPLEDGTYIRFLVFYGLVFPAYVLLFMVAGTGGAPSRRTWITFGVIMIASMPCYELGFLHGMPQLLLVPLVVLIAWAWRRTR